MIYGIEMTRRERGVNNVKIASWAPPRGEHNSSPLLSFSEKCSLGPQKRRCSRQRPVFLLGQLVKQCPAAASGVFSSALSHSLTQSRAAQDFES